MSIYPPLSSIFLLSNPCILFSPPAGLLYNQVYPTLLSANLLCYLAHGYLRPACLALNDLGHRLRKSSFNGVGIMRGASALHQQQIPHCCGAIP
jgi:hypothetical protein